MRIKSDYLLCFIFICILAIGCSHKKPPQSQLPLPPLGDSGVADGWYYQSEFGFGLPIPKGYAAYAPLSDDDAGEDFDEWVRLTDTKREAVIRIFTQMCEPGKPPGAAELKASLERVFETSEYKILGTGKTQTWSAGNDKWHVMPYDLKDKVQKEWHTWACALPQDEYVIWVRVTMTKALGNGPKGEKMYAQMKGLLPQVKWFRPVGPRGISLEQFELTRFTSDLKSALESGSTLKTLHYFDDTSAERIPWSSWYRKAVVVDAKGNVPDGALKAELTGLVINGSSASVYYMFQVKGSEPQRVGFKVSKSEGSWKIVARAKTD